MEKAKSPAILLPLFSFTGRISALQMVSFQITNSAGGIEQQQLLDDVIWNLICFLDLETQISFAAQSTLLQEKMAFCLDFTPEGNLQSYKSRLQEQSSDCRTRQPQTTFLAPFFHLLGYSNQLPRQQGYWWLCIVWGEIELPGITAALLICHLFGINRGWYASCYGNQLYFGAE